MPIYLSNCCGSEMTIYNLDAEICPACGSHCEALEELTNEEAEDLYDNQKFDEYHDGERGAE